jgi:hypothetical protein
MRKNFEGGSGSVGPAILLIKLAVNQCSGRPPLDSEFCFPSRSHESFDSALDRGVTQPALMAVGSSSLLPQEQSINLRNGHATSKWALIGPSSFLNSPFPRSGFAESRKSEQTALACLGVPRRPVNPPTWMPFQEPTLFRVHAFEYYAWGLSAEFGEGQDHATACMLGKKPSQQAESILCGDGRTIYNDSLWFDLCHRPRHHTPGI